MTTLALRMAIEPCPHGCKEPVNVLFKKDMKQGGQLMGAIEHNGVTSPWKPVYGFEVLLRLPEPERPT